MCVAHHLRLAPPPMPPLPWYQQQLWMHITRIESKIFVTFTISVFFVSCVQYIVAFTLYLAMVLSLLNSFYFLVML